MASTLACTKPSKMRSNLVVENGVLERDAGLRGERVEQLLAALVEGHHLLLDVLRREELLLRVALLVDQLDDADHSSRCGEISGRYSIALGAVADLLVEAPIEAERRVGRDVVRRRRC